MERFKTLRTFTYNEELVVLRARLESEGIECFVRNEFTTQVDNFISNAIDGILLQVKTEDHEKAKSLLIEWGEWPESAVDKPSEFWLKFDEFTSRIPVLNKLEVLIRFFILVAAVLTAFGLVISLLIKPALEERLLGETWCVEYLAFGNHIYAPETITQDPTKSNPSIELYYSDFSCREPLAFESSSIQFPGFQTERIYASWFIDRGKFVIINADTLGHIFNGKYSIELAKNNLTLHSTNTSIYCTRRNNEFF